VAPFSVYESAKKAFQDFLCPQLEELKTQVQGLHAEICRLNEKVTEKIRPLEIRRLDEKIEALDKK
jgi:hypothetical protein